MAKHAVVAVFFAVMACVWSAPLVAHLATHLPGPGIGDNAIFLWNGWWMRTALATGVSYFHTSYIFVPVGVDLTLHAHTAMPSFVGATLLGRFPVVEALNLTTLGSLALNGFCAYLLAWRTTRDRGAAIVAGLIYGSSPYIAARLNGHFDLITAWTIPLFALCAIEARHGAWRWTIAAAVVLGLTAYVGYYYLVYEAALWLLILVMAAREWHFSFVPITTSRRRIALGLVIAMAVDLAIIALALATSGVDTRIGPIKIAIHDTFNPRQTLGLLLMIWLWVRFAPHIEAKPSSEWDGGRVARSLLIAAIVVLVVAWPIVWSAAHLLANGDYVTQRYLWRSAPKGVDLATVFLGDPFLGGFGAWVRAAYARFNIDQIEAGAWLGVFPLVMTVLAIHRRWTDSAVRRWTAIGAFFFVWALGPHLMFLGHNTGVILPQTILRYVPIVSNARVPSRAMVFAYLALAMLSAIGLAEWSRRSPRPALVTALMAAAVFFEFLPAPFPIAALDHPAIYDTLRDRPEPGALCELPLGFNDSFGETGTLDRRVLGYQSIHQRPEAGGFIARLPDTVRKYYQADPILSSLLRLSVHDGTAPPDPATLPDRAAAGEALKRDGIRFLMLNRETASPALIRYVEQVLPVSVIATEGHRSLYVVY